MKPLRLTDDARDELIDATDFYESQQPGLGHRFLSDYQVASQRVREHSSGWAIA